MGSRKDTLLIFSRQLWKGPWYNDSPSSSCCALRDVATEFSCQELELDFPIVCWGNDFTWDGVWKSPPANRSKAKDPHILRVNSYRVLLTRGRGGFIVFVPNEVGMHSTYEALKGAGMREMASVGVMLKIAGFGSKSSHSLIELLVL
jgi:DUF2075 family protein